MPINKVKPRNITGDTEELLDVFYTMFAGAMFEAQTKGEIKPFSASRKTIPSRKHRGDQENSNKYRKAFLQ